MISRILAIETSCDETAVAILECGDSSIGKPSRIKSLKANLVYSQMALHEPYGGVVPELASREHIKNLPEMLNAALASADLRLDQLDAVAVTHGPGLKGCLLVGLSYAKALAWSLSKPLLCINHLEGHLWAHEMNDPQCEVDLPAIALLVSGGHTLLVLIRDFGDYSILARTRDDAAGEAFDKSATILGLPYPGGPSLSRCASSGDGTKFQFPIALRDDSSSFSFSGLKTSVARTVAKLGEQLHEPQVLSDLSASIECAIVESLVSKTILCAKDNRAASIILTGGVAANDRLRARLLDAALQSGCRLFVPEKQWCTDNAAMIAVAAAKRIERKPEIYLNWAGSCESGFLGPDVRMDVDADSKLSLRIE